MCAVEGNVMLLYGLVGGVHSPGFEGSENLSCQALMNADGLYLVSYYALLLNLKLFCCEYYHRKPTCALVSLVFLHYFTINVKYMGHFCPEPRFICDPVCDGGVE